MGNDIYVSYAKKPDDTFFMMKGHRDFAIDNGLPLPPAVEKYFADNVVCPEGIRIQIPTDYQYTDTDYFTITFNVADIPNEATTIIVEYG